MYFIESVSSLLDLSQTEDRGQVSLEQRPESSRREDGPDAVDIEVHDQLVLDVVVWPDHWRVGLNSFLRSLIHRLSLPWLGSVLLYGFRDYPVSLRGTKCCRGTYVLLISSPLRSIYVKTLRSLRGGFSVRAKKFASAWGHRPTLLSYLVPSSSQFPHLCHLHRTWRLSRGCAFGRVVATVGPPRPGSVAFLS